MGFLSCLFGCMTICGCKNPIIRKYGFFPPYPPGYQMIVSKNDKTLVFFLRLGNCFIGRKRK